MTHRDTGCAQPATMTVLFCANPPYYQHMGTAAKSVLDNTRDCFVDFRLITCDGDEEGERKLRDSIVGERSTLTIHRVDDRQLERFFVDKFMTKECYLRLLAPEVLPRQIDRVLYLDCDLVAIDDLEPLWHLDLQGRPLAAAPDFPRLPSVLSAERRASLGIPPDHLYVNSGVLVMDLDHWRRLGLTERLLRFVETAGDRLEFYDQDAINAVLHDDILLLDPRWNLQARMYRCRGADYAFEMARTRDAFRRPAIIHYTGSEKPWLFRSRTPRKGDYGKYLKRTAWRGAAPALGSPLQRAEYRMDRMLSSVGIDYLQGLYLARRVPEKLRALIGSAPRRPGAAGALGAAAGDDGAGIR